MIDMEPIEWSVIVVGLGIVIRVYHRWVVRKAIDKAEETAARSADAAEASALQAQRAADAADEAVSLKREDLHSQERERIIAMIHGAIKQEIDNTDLQIVGDAIPDEFLPEWREMVMVARTRGVTTGEIPGRLIKLFLQASKRLREWEEEHPPGGLKKPPPEGVALA